MTTSTLTTVVVFLPLGLLQGVVGQFFKALSLTLTIAVLVSLVLALTIVPLLGEQFLDADARRTTAAETSRHRSRARRPRHRPAGRPLRAGAGAPRCITRAPARAVGGGAGGRGRASRTASWAPGFLPEMDEGAFVLDYFTPGRNGARGDRPSGARRRRILAATPEIEGTSRRTGAELGLFATEQNTRRHRGPAQAAEPRSRSVFEVIDDVAAADRGGGAPAAHRVRPDPLRRDQRPRRQRQPVEIKLFGEQLDALEAYAKQLEPEMEKVDGPRGPLQRRERAQRRDAAEGRARPRRNRVGLTPEQVGAAVSGRAARRPGGRGAPRRPHGRGARPRARRRALRPAPARRAPGVERRSCSPPRSAALATFTARRVARRALPREPAAHDRHHRRRERPVAGRRDGRT